MTAIAITSSLTTSSCDTDKGQWKLDCIHSSLKSENSKDRLKGQQISKKKNGQEQI
jgi:hypothetical protein